MNSSRFWEVTFARLLSTYAVLTFALLWLGLAAVLFFNREWPAMLWEQVQALPVAAQVVIWLALLPIMVALWTWQSSWDAAVRVLAFAGIAGWTLLAVSSFVRSMRPVGRRDIQDDSPA